MTVLIYTFSENERANCDEEDEVVTRPELWPSRNDPSYEFVPSVHRGFCLSTTVTLLAQIMFLFGDTTVTANYFASLSMLLLIY